ncbi:MAG: HTTM domain-containing protein [Myxococcota bacterium]
MSLKERALSALARPLDSVGLAAFRVLFGTVLSVSAFRFLGNGWVDDFFIEPSFHFSYFGFPFVEPLPRGWLVAGFVVLGICGIFVALGLFYRVAVVTYFVLFTYVELIDVTYYLNHYYLVSLLCLWMSFMPLHRAWSLDVLRKPALRQETFPAYFTYLLRFQVGVVYFYAGVAKFGSDWLLHGQPLSIWLSARTDVPLVGSLFDVPYAALVMSWAGFLHDILVVPFLLWKRSRPYAYGALVVFHLVTGMLFNIGMFPFIMIVAASIFFSPSWPRRVFGRWLGPKVETKTTLEVTLGRRGQSVALAVAALCLLQVLVPLRTFAYGGDVLWHEQGMRYSWRVMVREKNGSVTYRVRVDGESRERHVYPRRYLTENQEREMSGQPDLILQLAHHIRDEFVARGHRDVEVRCDAIASLNGRLAVPLIDPDVDLATVEDSVWPAPWIQPAPTSPPIELRSPRGRIAGSQP